MKTLCRAALFFVALAIAATPASAGLILAPGSLWEYTFTDPTGDLSWATTGAWADSHSGHAPFSNVTSGDFAQGTSWPTGEANDRSGFVDDLWVRTTFDTTGYVLSSIKWNLGVDNGFKLYLNGALVSFDNAEGFTFRWEYNGDFSGLPLASGTNTLAVALEDHGGLTAFDMQVTGEPVPEPGTLLLLGGGLSALALRRRRQR